MTIAISLEITEINIQPLVMWKIWKETESGWISLIQPTNPAVGF